MARTLLLEVTNDILMLQLPQNGDFLFERFQPGLVDVIQLDLFHSDHFPRFFNHSKINARVGAISDQLAKSPSKLNGWNPSRARQLLLLILVNVL